MTKTEKIRYYQKFEKLVRPRIKYKLKTKEMIDLITLKRDEYWTSVTN